MKKIFLTAAAVLAFGFAGAQETSTPGFAAGDVFVSGTVSFGTQKTGDIKTNQFTVIPSAGYFVTPNIALGVQAGYTKTTNTEETDLGNFETEIRTFQAGAFGRYYFTPANSFSLFAQLGAAYGNSTAEDGTGEYKINRFSAAFAPGVNYFVSDHFALEATFGIVGYSTTNPDFEGAQTQKTFVIGLDMTDINFGIVYKF